MKQAPAFAVNLILTLSEEEWNRNITPEQRTDCLCEKLRNAIHLLGGMNQKRFINATLQSLEPSHFAKG